MFIQVNNDGDITSLGSELLGYYNNSDEAASIVLGGDHSSLYNPVSFQDATTHTEFTRGYACDRDDLVVVKNEMHIEYLYLYDCTTETWLYHAGSGYEPLFIKLEHAVKISLAVQ